MPESAPSSEAESVSQSGCRPRITRVVRGALHRCRPRCQGPRRRHKRNPKPVRHFVNLCARPDPHTYRDRRGERPPSADGIPEHETKDESHSERHFGTTLPTCSGPKPSGRETLTGAGRNESHHTTRQALPRAEGVVVKTHGRRPLTSSSREKPWQRWRLHKKANAGEALAVRGDGRRGVLPMRRRAISKLRFTHGGAAKPQPPAFSNPAGDYRFHAVVWGRTKMGCTAHGCSRPGRGKSRGARRCETS
jgi:hypothetical protein